MSSSQFSERIEFYMPKTMDTTLHKARICYEHGQPRQENINKSRDMPITFLDNHKPCFKPSPYRKHKNGFPLNKKFNKIGGKTNVPVPNANRLVVNEGANATPLQIKCWKC